MRNLTIHLRRLFLTEPPKRDIEFSWWFVKQGHVVWDEQLRVLGIGLGTRDRFIRSLLRQSTKTLETWDTATYRAFAEDRGPGGSFPRSFSSLCITSATPTFRLEHP